MMQNVARQDFPVHCARAYLEPGRMLLLPSAHEGQRNVMTLGWHMVMEFTPLLVACMISAGNHSFELVRESRRCVLNLPTEAMVDTVVGIGNCSGVEVDKFETFSITALAAQKVAASMIGECHASFECELVEDSLVDRYNLFIFEIVKAHVAPRPKHPRTLHYTGDGVFMVAGRIVSRRQLFNPELLGKWRAI